MFEQREKKKPARSMVLYAMGILLVSTILGAFTLGVKARLDETETCGYSACGDVVSNADSSKATALNCGCQCESTQLLTEECKQSYDCVRNETCWKLRGK